MTKRRGDYRGLYASYWDDPDLQEALQAEARLLFATLTTCQAYGFAGIFRYYIDTLQAQTGLTAAKGWVNGQFGILFAQLEKAGLIRHDPKQAVVWIVDGIENDASINLANAKQRPEVFAQLRAIPKTRLLVEFLEHYGAQLGEIPEDIQARAEDLVRNSTPADDGGSAQLFHVADAVDTKRAFPLLPLPSLPKEKEKRVAPASPAAAPAPLGAVAQRDRERGEEADRLARELCDLAGEKGAVAGVVCRFYLEEAERGLVDFYEKRGGLYTPTRRRDLLAGLVKVAGKTPSAMLFALEKYIDLKAGVADEHWLLGAARGLARDLAASVKEFDDGIEAHRRRHKGGAAAQAAEVVDA